MICVHNKVREFNIEQSKWLEKVKRQPLDFSFQILNLVWWSLLGFLLCQKMLNMKFWKKEKKKMVKTFTSHPKRFYTRKHNDKALTGQWLWSYMNHHYLQISYFSNTVFGIDNYTWRNICSFVEEFDKSVRLHFPSHITQRFVCLVFGCYMLELSDVLNYTFLLENKLNSPYHYSKSGVWILSIDSFWYSLKWIRKPQYEIILMNIATENETL